MGFKLRLFKYINHSFNEANEVFIKLELFVLLSW